MSKTDWDTRLLVVTDLDGSLLDHHDYGWEDARPALNLLRHLRVPLIFNTSKTLAETLELQRQLDISHPFIVENGSGVVIPGRYFSTPPPGCLSLDSLLATEGVALAAEVPPAAAGGFSPSPGPLQNAFYVKLFGPQYRDIRRLLCDARDREPFRFTGFGDMSDRELQRVTGLSLDSCIKAKQRLFSEPLLWNDSDAALERFASILGPNGLKITRGGRFVHVTGDSDKGRAMQWLVSCYCTTDYCTAEYCSTEYLAADRAGRQLRLEVLALGDGDNDIPMLKLADTAVIIRSPVNAPPRWPGCEKASLTEARGPRGWNAAVLEKLSTLHSIEPMNLEGRTDG